MVAEIKINYLLILLLYMVSQVIKITHTFEEYLIMKTTSGLVKGKLNEFKGFSYYSFQGIPYSESMVGEFRFLPPIPKKPWPYILDATREGPVCPQDGQRYKRKEMSEDCLFLNVYVPANITNKLLPTFVNIHGGGYSLLSGNSDFIYGPEYLLQKKIIYISMNYRLHAFGFLSLNTNDACGNAGIKDIILSLKWIKQNLKSFGGDNTKITVGGHSSGGTLAHLLMFSKNTTGLFQQLIIISGIVLNHRSLAKHPEDIAFLLAKELNIKSNDSRILLQNLKRADTFEIVEGYSRMYKADPNTIRPYSSFVPSVEKTCLDSIIDTQPAVTLENGFLQTVPIMAGFNTNEGTYLVPRILNNLAEIKNINENLELLIPSDIEYPQGSREAKKLANSITHFYFGKNNIMDGHDFCLMCLIDYITDIQYGVYSIDLWARKYKSRNDSNELYLYEFNFDGMMNWAKIAYEINVPGTSHADEQGYLFLTQYTQIREELIDSRSKKMRETMTSLFTNFIKYGNPTPPNKSSEIFWPEYGKEQNYLQINDKPQVMQRKFSSKVANMNFWDKVYEDYNNYVKSGGQLEKKVIP